jgi:hypothetical protein
VACLDMIPWGRPPNLGDVGFVILCVTLYSAFLADSRRSGAVPAVRFVFFCSISAAHSAAPTAVPAVSHGGVTEQGSRYSPVFVNTKNVDTNGTISKIVATVPNLDFQLAIFDHP